MNKKQWIAFEFLIIGIISILAISFIVLHKAHGDNGINFEQCAAQPNHKCMVQLPSQNLSNMSNPNEYVHIIFPDNTAKQVMGVFNPENYTNLKNNPTVMYVEFATTSSTPNLNYCPVGKASLLGQDGYLIKLYNPTAHINYTHLAYPDFCYTETGNNPIDGSGPKAIAEFPGVAIGFAFILLAAILITRSHKKK